MHLHSIRWRTSKLFAGSFSTRPHFTTRNHPAKMCQAPGERANHLKLIVLAFVLARSGTNADGNKSDSIETPARLAPN